MWIPDTNLALSRIKWRVSQGGHNVPKPDVIRRFKRSISNFFKIYGPYADSWMLFNNAGLIPVLIAQRKNDKIKVINNDFYNQVLEGIGGCI